MTLKRIFGIVSDIDGVLVRGSDPIKNVKQSIYIKIKLLAI
jgi:ribonucleotide monophosphatase NagD (HAD superfamily)